MSRWPQGTVGANVHKGSRQVQEADPPPPSDLTRPQPQTSPAAPPLAGDAKPGVQVSSFQTGDQKGLGRSTERAQTSRLPRTRAPGAGARGACFRGPSTSLRRKQVWGFSDEALTPRVSPPPAPRNPGELPAPETRTCLPSPECSRQARGARGLCASSGKRREVGRGVSLSTPPPAPNPASVSPCARPTWPMGERGPAASAAEAQGGPGALSWRWDSGGGRAPRGCCAWGGV